MIKTQDFIKKINSEIVSRSGVLAVVKVLESGVLSRPEGGPHVKKFQNRMSKLINKKFCFATTSGTSSLHAAIALLQLNKDDEVLIPAITFMADASVVLQEKAKLVFVDISKEDFNMDPADAIRKISKKTRAMIVVHMYGQPANMDKFVEIAKKYSLVLIEDCAQAMGATYKDRLVGSFGDISCFSFYQTKHLVSGEGGMIAVNSDKYAESLKSILNNGIKRSRLEDYDFDRIGFNYQMTEIQAAILLSQLNRLIRLNNTRIRNANIYRKILNDTDIQFQSTDSNSVNVYCYLTCLLPKRLCAKRDLFVAKVQKEGIPIKKQYPLSLPETEFIQKLFPNLPKNTPVACDFSKRVFNLYVNPGLDEVDINNFAQKILNIYKKI